MAFRDLKIGKKLAISFALIVVVMASANIYAVLRMRTLSEEIEEVTSKHLRMALAIASMNSGVAQLRAVQLARVQAPADSLTRLDRSMGELIDNIVRDLATYDTLATAETDRLLYDKFEASWDRYTEYFYEFLGLMQDDRRDDALALLRGDALVAHNELTGVLEEIVGSGARAARAASDGANRTFVGTRRVLRTLALAAVVLAILIATVLGRRISRPMRQLAGAAGSVAEGNLDVEVPVSGGDEIGRLSESFNSMTRSLREARARITTQQNKLQAANDELNVKNDDLEKAMQQLKETQQQLIMSEKMASLGNLVAGVAHEINNPVGAVTSAADTSARSIEILRKLIAEAEDLAALIESPRFATAIEVLKSNNDITVTASRRITDIVKSLKNFARLDESEFQEADIHEGIDSTLTLLHHQMKNRVEIVKEYEEIPRIQCYPNQLNQVFMNILANAQQAIAGEGRITIRTWHDDKNVYVQFADTGRGIRQDDLAHIFDPGFTTKGVGVGTGLGLSITYNIIRKHNGTIEAQSSVGEGTTMTIQLPIRQENKST